MPAAPLSASLIARAALVAKSEGVQITLESGKVRMTIAPNAETALPSPETEEAAWDKKIARKAAR